MLILIRIASNVILNVQNVKIQQLNVHLVRLQVLISLIANVKQDKYVFLAAINVMGVLSVSRIVLVARM
jgi:hypothetical protein